MVNVSVPFETALIRGSAASRCVHSIAVYFIWVSFQVRGWDTATDCSFKAEKELLFILFSCQTRVTTLCLYTTANQCSLSPSRFLTCCIHNNMRSLWPLTFDHWNLISLSWVQLVKMWRNYQKTDLRYHVQEAKTCFVTLTFDLEHPNLMSSSVSLDFSLITDSVVVDSQRLTVKSLPQLWSQTPHIWENWIWATTACRTQEWSRKWSCCVLDWRVQTVDWRLWGQVLKSLNVHFSNFLSYFVIIYLNGLSSALLTVPQSSVTHPACQSHPPHQLHSPALTCSWSLRKCQ